jgi:hypothetical protein
MLLPRLLEYRSKQEHLVKLIELRHVLHYELYLLRDLAVDRLLQLLYLLEDLPLL